MMFHTTILRRGLPLAWVALGLLVTLPGCGGDDPPPGDGPANAGTDAGGGKTDPQANQPPPPPAWTEPLNAAVDHLDHARLDEADEQLQAAEALLSAAEGGDEKTAGDRKLDSLKSQLASAREAEVRRLAGEKVRKRAERLATAKELQESGNLDEATAALDGVLSMAPTAEQRETVRELKAAIEAHRSARRRLGSWMKMLASKQRSEVRAAQNQLRRDPDTAIPLLLEAVRSQDKLLVKNTLEMLRRLRRPELAIPAMVGVLSRTDQQASWPDAAREISRLKQAGAGPLLLPLLERAKTPAQRAMALGALAHVPDPPAETLLVLLPVLHTDGPELEPALRAAHNTMTRHGQDELVALRGLPAVVSAENLVLLAKLPGRLVAVTGRKGDENAGVVSAARALAVMLGAIAPAPLVGLKVVSSVGEFEGSSAAAVLDGKWGAAEPMTMWRHPLGKPGTIILDLGAEKTVTAVRVWNYNGQGSGERGWKEIDVFVANARTDLEPEARGVVPPAPGSDEKPDFSISFPVAQVRGRYVILKSRSLWSASGYAGLSEIQVIGY